VLAPAIFLYTTKTVQNLVIQANYQHGASSTADFSRHHHSATAFPICSTPRATRARDLVLQQWRNQCQITQSNLNQKLVILNIKLNNIKPKNLPQPTKLIKLFGNYNQIRAKRSMKSPYNQDRKHNLTTLCLLYLKDATQATQYWLDKRNSIYRRHLHQILCQTPIAKQPNKRTSTPIHPLNYKTKCLRQGFHSNHQFHPYNNNPNKTTITHQFRYRVPGTHP
jgi:hypothetical protein